MALHNKYNKEENLKRLYAETFKRTTISFYRYVNIENPQEFRDTIYQQWDAFQCLGRIYIAKEGINAQMSVPEHQMEAFLSLLESTSGFEQMPIKYAVEDDGKSFFKLTVKVRPKIVADGLNDGDFDTTNVGKHLTATEFHKEVGKEENIIIDMRNHYESEIGHFENAVLPDVDTFREEIEFVVEEYKDQKDKKFLLYCTGGVRCEKASAYFKHHGFEDVNQLHGGVIEYAQQIKKLGWDSRFKGSNFVFDQRLGETIDGQVISKCHQCGQPSAAHTNCENKACHLLFIQCSDCASEYDGCCSTECKTVINLPEEEQIQIRKATMHKNALKRSYHKGRHNVLS